MRRDEYDRNPFSAALQFELQLRPRHARHGDVQNEAASLTNDGGREEILGGRERLRREAELPGHVGEVFAYGLIVGDDRYERAYRHYDILMVSSSRMASRV